MRQKGLWAAILMIIIAVTGAKPALAADETVILGTELDRVVSSSTDLWAFAPDGDWFRRSATSLPLPPL